MQLSHVISVSEPGPERLSKFNVQSLFGIEPLLARRTRISEQVSTHLSAHQILQLYCCPT